MTADRARATLGDPGDPEVYGRLVRFATLAMRAPVAVLAAVEGDALVLVAKTGTPEPWPLARDLLREGIRVPAMAATGEAFVVEADAAPGGEAPRVPGPPQRLSFCAAPIVVGGELVAVLAVGDAQPRRWSPDDAALMRDLGAALLREIELSQRDPGPGTWAGGLPAPPPSPEPAEPTSRARAAGQDAVPVRDVPDGLIGVDSEWRIDLLNARARTLLGITEPAVIGRSLWEVSRALVGTAFHQECMKASGAPFEVEEYCHSQRLWLEIRAQPAGDGGTVLYLRDISRRRAEQEALRGREARYRSLFEESTTALFVMASDGTLIEVNDALVQLLGRAPEDLQGSMLVELADDSAAVARLLDELSGNGSAAEVEIPFRRGSGELIICMVSGAGHDLDGSVVYHGAMRDITQHKQAQEELVRSAARDPLTGLANRTVFMERLDHLLTHSKRRVGDRFAVLFIDLDNFKDVNDEHGHLVGDQVLVAVARRLETCVREADTVARIGGDEFGVLLETIQDGVSVTLVVDRVRESLGRTFEAERATGVTASIGIAMSASGYDRAEDLVRDADAAMYRAKAQGRNDYVIFDSDMHDSALLQRQLEDDLRVALDAGQLIVHYHPVVDLRGGALTGLEALVRWAHPRHGVLLPGEFMPLAERTGLSAEIGWWVLHEACSQMRRWQEEFPDVAGPLTLSVNLSARQFVHAEMLERIDATLAETGLAPAQLRLDLTESVVMQNAATASETLAALHARGIRICIDDFGTGYTSLQQLREFPISSLKIDGSFIRQLGASGASHEIVQSILALGRSMAIDAIAEGVETPEQLDELRRLGTRFAQGFLFSLPLDRHATGALLQQTRG